MPLFATMPTGYPWMCANPQTNVGPYRDLNSCSREPSTMRAITCLTSNAFELSSGMSPSNSDGSYNGASGSNSGAPAGAASPMCANTSRHKRSAVGSSWAKWSATPDFEVCTSAPPRSSAETSSPVDAFTSGGPPKKMVPLPFTMMFSSDIAGTYAPPAVQEPNTADNCGMPSEDMLAWLKKIRPKCIWSGNTSSCKGRNAPPESTKYKHGNLFSRATC
mmetsp:Transcript_17240/g.49838  ORF Transcript_17240/g.49838 Transcript_17240/m.49838 type:complete len:219 (+) Transcript_17240:700-1356(+)